MSANEPYTTVEHRGRSEYEDRKSVFIGRCAPVTHEEEAISFLEECRREYPDAKHHVYAYILRENAIMRFSDDREPQGTAGVPILDLMRKRGLTDIALVVTRYFGGTLLGTGGLVRAYTEAAAAAIDDAHVIRYEFFSLFYIRLSYADHAKFAPIADRFAFRQESVDFSAQVSLRGSVPSGDAEAFLAALSDATAGRADCELIGDFFDFPK